MMKNLLAIAGSDCSGGAGVQADLKTMTVHRTYAMSVITALTAQNTTGVYDIMEVAPAFVESQLDCVFGDIYPDAVKIGMVANTEIMRVIADKLLEYKATNIVVDPVMVSTSGHTLVSEEGIQSLFEHLLPLASLITPNIPEAEILAGIPIKNEEDMIKAGEIIYQKIKKPVLVKGGHLVNDATDLLYTDSGYTWFASKRIDNDNTHGTGCTLSSAIACNLGKGYTLIESIQNAKNYLTGALNAQLNLGKGSGPLAHNYCINEPTF